MEGSKQVDRCRVSAGAMYRCLGKASPAKARYKRNIRRARRRVMDAIMREQSE